MTNKKYYKLAKKLSALSIEEATNELKLIRKFNGDEEADKITAELSAVMAEVQDAVI